MITKLEYVLCAHNVQSELTGLLQNFLNEIRSGAELSVERDFARVLTALQPDKQTVRG